MDITYYKIANDSILHEIKDIRPEDWGRKLDWVDIKTTNRKEIANFFGKLNHFDDKLDCLEHPEAYAFSNTFGRTLILNLPISNANEIYNTEYISMIIDENLVITISPQANDLFNERNISPYSKNKYSSLLNFLLSILAVKILAQNKTCMSMARNDIQAIERKLKENHEVLTSMDLMSCERNISQLADIIEDQYVGFELLLSLGYVSTGQKEAKETDIIIKGFEPLNKAMARLEKKAESLRLQYMLIQQEKSTRKINVLTIIQAIFVPLTFIAGVYGMNFIVMPELEWRYSYLFVWIVFISLAVGLLRYFYKKGWFD